MHDEGQRRDSLRALRLYTLLVRLYPKAHRQAFGVQMQQTFVDHYRDIEDSQGRVGITFWLGVLGDAAWSIGREHLAALHGAVGRSGLWPYVPSGVVLSGAVVAAAAGDRNALLVCTLVAALVFAATSSAGLVPKLMTGGGGLGVVLAGGILGRHLWFQSDRRRDASLRATSGQRRKTVRHVCQMWGAVMGGNRHLLVLWAANRRVASRQDALRRLRHVQVVAAQRRKELEKAFLAA